MLFVVNTSYFLILNRRAPARLCRSYGIGSETCGLKLLNGEF